MNQEVQRTAEVAVREANKLFDEAATVTIRSETQLKGATEALAIVRSTQKNIKKQKDPIVKGINESLKLVRDLFRPAEEKLAAAESNLKTAMLKYQQRVEAKAVKQADAIEEKVDSGEMGLQEGMGKLSNIKQAPKSVQTESGGIQYRVVKKIRIVNVGELPPSYFMRESVVEALRKEVANDVLRQHKEVPTGAELYEEKIVAGTS